MPRGKRKPVEYVRYWISDRGKPGTERTIIKGSSIESVVNLYLGDPQSGYLIHVNNRIVSEPAGAVRQNDRIEVERASS